MKEPKVPVQKLLQLYLAVADLVDAGDCADVPVDAAYNAVFETAWGQKTYSEAVEAANRKLG